MSDPTSVLLVVVPIVAAVVSVASGLTFQRSGWSVATLALIVQTALAASLAQTVYTTGEVTYYVGGFEPPYGIELVVDAVSATVVLLVAVVSLGVLAYSRRAGPRGTAFYGQYLLLVTGLSGMSITGDVFNLYVFLEITGLAAYALVASGETGRAAIGALRYLLIGTVGASLYLLGIGYAFLATGTLNMADLAGSLAAVGYGDTLVQAAFALIVAGLAVKAALFPLHTWQPEAYASAPDSVSALISALVSTVSAYALLRIVLSVFTVDFFTVNPLAQDALLALAGVSVVAGASLAVMQSEVKRMLAYSSVSQFGLVVAAVAVATETAVIGSVVHLVGHAIMKGGLFAAAGAIAAATGARTVDEYAGLSGRRPYLSGLFAIIALAMVGVPPAVGFVGKWYIVLGAVEAGAWPITVVVVASTLLSLAYFIRLLERMYFREAPEPAEIDPQAVADGGADTVNGDTDDRDAGVSAGMIAVVVVAAVLAVGLGMLGETFAQLLEPTINSLLTP